MLKVAIYYGFLLGLALGAALGVVAYFETVALARGAGLGEVEVTAFAVAVAGGAVVGGVILWSFGGLLAGLLWRRVVLPWPLFGAAVGLLVAAVDMALYIASQLEPDPKFIPVHVAIGVALAAILKRKSRSGVGA
jgi:hypothetical protein